jgi:hypothetical protein
MNAATYKVSLWLQNDQGFWEMFKNQGAEEIQEGFEELLESGLTREQRESFPHQLLLDLLGSVDWYEIRECMREE